MVAPFSKFTAKFGLVFVLTLENAVFLRGFIFKRTERAQVLPKDGTMDFQNSPLFERSACFYVVISENFEHFQYFNFDTDFLEHEIFFQQTNFQLNALRIKGHHFHTKLTYQKPILRQIEWYITTKWAYQRGLTFASNYFIFLKVLFQFKDLL